MFPTDYCGATHNVQQSAIGTPSGPYVTKTSRQSEEAQYYTTRPPTTSQNNACQLKWHERPPLPWWRIAAVVVPSKYLRAALLSTVALLH